MADLAIRGTARREAAADRACAALDGTCSHAVAAVLEATAHDDDREVRAAGQRVVRSLIDGTLDGGDPGAVRDALLTDGDLGRAVADAITEPYDVTGAWFMTYYGQALLDAGKSDQARKVAEALRESVAAARKPQAKVGIIANAVPLVAKVDGPKAALDLVGEGLELAGGQDADPADSRVVFLRGQQRLRQAEAAGDDAELRSFYEKSVADAAVPERLRVESAWKLARLAFRSGDAATERRMLRYVVSHGGKLALVAPARKQLDALGDA